MQITIHVEKAAKDFVVDWDKVSDAGKAYVIAYGLKQSLNDSAASAKDESDAVKKSDARFAGIMDGTVRAGSGGGAPLSPMEKALREVVGQYLRAIGTKAAEATKAAKDPRAGFALVVESKLKAAGKTADADAIEAAVVANWPKIEAQATKIAEASKTTGEIEI
jgi:hypothetical protein